MLMDTGVQPRLSTIDRSAKPLPKQAAWERWNNPSLHEA